MTHAFRTSLLLTALIPSAASAQTLQTGKWTGTIAPPGQATENVSYDVAAKGDSIAITIVSGTHGSFAFNDVKLTAGKLTFYWSPGTRVDCTLNRRADGAFAGTCGDAGS